MIQDLYIGVDGGGTKCKVRIEDSAGNLLGQTKGGPANIRLSVTRSWQSITDAVKEALEEAKISLNDKNYNFHAGLALAGTEVKEAVSDFLNTPSSFKKICLKSDGYAACLGAHNGKNGAIIIIGTGVIGWRIHDQDTIQVGGWGFPHDDIGGGAWLGLQAVRATLHAHDGRGSFSPLLQAILAKFSHNFSALVSWANNAQSTQFAEIAPLVINHAKDKDPIAVSLLQQAAHEIDHIATTMEKRAINRDAQLPYSLFGGIAPFLEPWLSKDLQQRLVPRQHDATYGAILMIKRSMKC